MIESTKTIPPYQINIFGAGLVGSLLSIFLARRGYRVGLYERRSDMRTSDKDEGRSINLALSDRGLKALAAVGIEKAVLNEAIPMYGRMIHDEKGKLTFQPYGKEGQAICSVSRSGLNKLLLNAAERFENVSLYFDERCTSVDLSRTAAHMHHTVKGHDRVLTSDVIFGTDGAFSAVRGSMQITDRYNYSQSYIEHGYKELTIPPGPNNSHLLEKNALHIWPRHRYMLIALPNTDGSFTCTLFFPFEGDISFDRLRTPEDLKVFFEKNFPDVVPLMPHLTDEFFSNPTSSLVTVHCWPWVTNRTALIGDAAHAIVPFFGQGMNAGFEDCRILDELITEYEGDWPKILQAFQVTRKPDADAVAELALQNFIEMRDLIADKNFLLRKKIEARMHELFPDKWVPLYSMVTFSDMPYSEALRLGREHDLLMQRVMSTEDIEEKWQTPELQTIVENIFRNS